MEARAVKSLMLAGLLIGAAPGVSTEAQPLSGLSYLRFTRTVALPGVELPPGTYRFELALPLSEDNVVRVSNLDRTKIYLTAFTYPIKKPANLPDGAVVTFGEAPNGDPLPITAWYPTGSERGRQFLYR